ncbi:MAG: pesticin [Acidobacteriota bacterium]|nr:pesticin [Acidobacteriota bacterium]
MSTSRKSLAPIVIKKYENRRLYDTHSSRYVNLEGVAELVRGGRDIQVVDSKTGEDVTRHVLTQIIVDGAKDPEHGPPLEFLRDLVRARDQAGRDFFQWYLKSAGEVYERVRETMQRSPFAPDPSWMRLWDPRAMAEEMHAQMTRQMEGVFGRGGGAGRGREAQEPPAPPPTAASAPEDGGDATRAELDELKGRLQDLERRLADAPD